MTVTGRPWTSRNSSECQLVEQAIARGEKRLRIMQQLGCSYDEVKRVHDRMNARAGFPGVNHERIAS